MEEIYSRVYKIDMIGHIIVTVVFSIICIVLFYLFKIGLKEEQAGQKTQKYCIRFGFMICLMMLFLITIFDVYFGYFSKLNGGAYY